ncbi:MAG: S8 family serine peptidase [Candidatus Sericytochromatia bacterium]|nr:S8 family serine peptidase [Candidatus Sericytochromatia bacterium]
MTRRLSSSLALLLASAALAACRAPALGVADGATGAMGARPAVAQAAPGPASPAAPAPGPAATDGVASRVDTVLARPAPVRVGRLPGARGELYTGAYLVKLAAGRDEAGLLGHPALAGARARGTLQMGRGLLVRLEPPAGAEPSAWRAAVASVPGVIGVTPEARRFLHQLTSTDPLIGRQWAHRTDLANTPGAWSVVPVADQAKVVVAVLDSGLDVGHPEFAGRIVGQRNSTASAADPSDVTDVEGHGTHVTGIVGANGADGNGIAGVAWGAKILPVKVFPDNAAGTDMDILSGFMYAINWRPTPDDGSRVRVVNMSLGSPTGEVSALWLEAVQIARDLGVVVVVASGNEALPFAATPANTPGVLSVGSTAQYLGWESVSGFSNGGPTLDLVAPGEDILSTLPTAGSTLGMATYGSTSGTSMASPYVAGVAALAVARYDKNNARVEGSFVDLLLARLRKAVTDLGPPGRDSLSGFGRLDARRAVAPETLEEAP